MDGLGRIYDYGLWPLVIIHISIFVFFIFSFLLPKNKKKYEWRSLGVFTGFIVALFFEMYGFPLTIYFLSPLLINKLGINDPFSHLKGHLWGTLLGLPNWAGALICLLGSLVMAGGIWVIVAGWRKIHRADNLLVTDGIYGYIRHPQYLGIFFVTTGAMIQWPTIITVLMWPVLIFFYIALSKREEKEMERIFGLSYVEYRSNVPAFMFRFPKKGSHAKE
ncbi:MAG: methyltransferase family protein [Actinomycetota bacterium]